MTVQRKEVSLQEWRKIEKEANVKYLPHYAYQVGGRDFRRLGGRVTSFQNGEVIHTDYICIVEDD